MEEDKDVYDELRYWITPDGELIEVPDDHQRLLKKLTGLKKETALKRGWIRVIRDPKFSDYWYFEIQSASSDALELIEDFLLSPENKQTGDDVAASISVIEPKAMSFPIEWKDLEEMSFGEAAEKSFLREYRRPEGYRWYELRRNPRRRSRR